ncbi:AAA family ATPase [Micromonospora sp. HUAS YX12]|uniref:AAA family ATPase n=1 Tax=Micromonospora sp. HUAS YX12 TaxID=3156396 RepID=A0AAU7R1H0_9ACTN
MTAAVQDVTRQAEQIVIGTAMTTPAHADEMLGLVAVDQLGTPAHRAIWRAVAGLRQRGEPTDPAAVAAALLAAEELHKAGGAAYLHTCMEAVPVTAQGPHYAGLVTEAAHQRGTQLAAEVTRRAGETADPIARRALLDQARAALDALEARSPGQQPSHLDRLRAALLDSAGLDTIPDPEPLIGEDVLFRDSLVWVVGKPGHGKSFVVLDMAAAVGTGEPWQTYPVQQGPVVFLVAEGARGTKKRVRAWETAMGRRMENVYFLPLPVQSTNRAEWDALVELCREIGAVMVVIDTQARVTVGVEENSNTEMGHFVDQAEKLRAASAACVVIVHHIGRNGETRSRCSRSAGVPGCP